jgi:hypothetical protein
MSTTMATLQLLTLPPPTSVLKLTKRDPGDEADKDLIAQYQSPVAKLLYPTSIIRPDLAWQVNYMARFATNPTEEQMSLLKHMLRYYKARQHLVLSTAASLKPISTTQIT